MPETSHPHGADTGASCRSGEATTQPTGTQNCHFRQQHPLPVPRHNLPKYCGSTKTPNGKEKREIASPVTGWVLSRSLTRAGVLRPRGAWLWVVNGSAAGQRKIRGLSEMLVSGAGPWGGGSQGKGPRGDGAQGSQGGMDRAGRVMPSAPAACDLLL